MDEQLKRIESKLDYLIDNVEKLVNIEYDRKHNDAEKRKRVYELLDSIKGL